MKKEVYIVLFFSFFSLSFHLLNFNVIAQEKNKKTAPDEVNSYIQKFKDILVIDLFTDNYHYDFSVERNGSRVLITPNTPFRTNLAVSYKFIRLQYGISNLFNEVNTTINGKTNDTNIKINFFIKRFRQIISYNSIQGMYLENTAEIIDNYERGQPKKQYPDMAQYLFEGQSSYNFNPNFSHRTLDLENEWQKRSAISFSPYFIYNYRRVRDIPSKRTYRYLPLQLLQSIDNFDFDFQPRFYSIFIYKENWFLMTMLYPSIGYRYSANEGTHTGTDNKFYSYNHILFWGGGSRIQIGYNSSNFYAGSIYTLSITQFKVNNSFISDSRGYFSIYLGFRFTLPNFLKHTLKKEEIMIDIQHAKD